MLMEFLILERDFCLLIFDFDEFLKAFFITQKARSREMMTFMTTARQVSRKILEKFSYANFIS